MLPGDRVVVFDSIAWSHLKVSAKDCHKPATVVAYYSIYKSTLGRYNALIDVIFDDRPDDVSKGHFTEHIHDRLL